MKRALVTLLLAGCAAGPDYTLPDTTAPAGFAGASEQFPATAPDLAWWHALGAPTLDDLVERALRDNLDLRAALARIAQARAAAGVADAALQPQLDANGSYERVDTTESTPLPIRGIQYDAWSLGLGASWELDLFGRLRRESEARGAELGAAEADARGVRLALVAEVVVAYADLHGALRRQQVLEASVAAAKELVALTKSRADGGLGTDLDVSRAERLLLATRARQPAFERDWRRAAHRLAVLTGRTPGELLAALRDAAPLQAVPDMVAIGLPAETVRQRPDVQAAERRLHAATARLGVAMAERYPRLSLAGFFGLESNRGADLLRASSNAWRVGPTVRVPLFTGGNVSAQIRVREAELEEARLALEQQVLLVFEEVETAVASLQQERKRNAELASAVATAERTRSLAQQRFEAGLDDFLAVLEAEQARLDLADQQAAAAAEVVRQFATLHKALGGAPATSAAEQG